MLSSFQHLKVRFKVGAIHPWTSVTVPQFMADPDRHEDILYLHHTMYVHALHAMLPIERFHLTINSKKTKALSFRDGQTDSIHSSLGRSYGAPIQGWRVYLWTYRIYRHTVFSTIMLIPYLYKFFDHNNIILICGSSQHLFPLVVHVSVL